MDVLADVLSLAGVRGTAAVRIDGGAGWGVSWAKDADAALYAVTTGTAWLSVESGPAGPTRPAGERAAAPIELLPGDVVLLPTGVAHGITSDAGRTPAPCDLALASESRRAGAPMLLGTGDTRTRLLGASYRHDRLVSSHVFDLLPAVVHVRGDPANAALADTVRLLAREAGDPRIASSVVLDRLMDVVLVELLRWWLSSHPDQVSGCWLGGLEDPLVAAAMARLHRDPAHPWSTDELARALAVSRSTLSRRFLQVTGQSPGGYLTRWRMDLAARKLRDSHDSVESVARSVGYTSVYAFNRAFRRVRGRPPARFRQDARAAATSTLPPL